MKSDCGSRLNSFNLCPLYIILSLVKYLWVRPGASYTQNKTPVMGLIGYDPAIAANGSYETAKRSLKRSGKTQCKNALINRTFK